MSFLYSVICLYSTDDHTAIVRETQSVVFENI